MTGWPNYPVVYEINTAAWLGDLRRQFKRQITLGTVPQEELDRLAGFHFDAVWLMGVWQRSKQARSIALQHAGLQAEYRHALPDYTDDDCFGSPYAIYAYCVEPDFGSNVELAAFRDRLRKLGMRLILDFVPNHLAVDNPCLTTFPERFVRGTPINLQHEPQNYFVSESTAARTIFAHGRDPYFDGWTDTVQLDYRRSETRQAMADVLLDLVNHCDGLRCDMAMLVLREQFLRVWGGTFDQPQAEFWPMAIRGIKEKQPDFLMVAEVYWDLEYKLQELGFDYTYDKRLYERLLGDNVGSVRAHLHANLDFQRRLVRFIENHDERRAADAFGVSKSKAAAVVALALPGMRLIHEGQIEGYVRKLPVQLGRRSHEPAQDELVTFYKCLLTELHRDLLHEGQWQLLEPKEAWTGDPTYSNLIAGCWTLNAKCYVVVVNLAPSRSQCFLPLHFSVLSRHDWRLKDLFRNREYARSGDDLSSRGLYAELDAFDFHVFDFQQQQAAAPDVATFSPRLGQGLKRRNSLHAQPSGISSLSWSPDGKMIAFSLQTGRICLWSAETSTWVLCPESGTGPVGCVAWSADGRQLASGSDDRDVRVWDVNTAALLHRFCGHGDHVLTVAWSPDGKLLASGGIDRVTKVWDTNADTLLATLAGHSDPVNCVSWSPDGKHLASGSGDRSIRVWDVTSWNLLKELHSTDWISSLAWSPDGLLIASGTGGGVVEIWSWESGRIVQTLERHTRRILCVAFSHDGRLLASKSNDGTVRLWDTRSWSELTLLEEGGQYLSGLAFHPSQAILATRDDSQNVIRIWDVAVDELLGPAVRSSSVHYVNAKIVLVGDTGVGKTGLGLVLSGQPFAPPESSHGRHIWTLESREVKCADGREENREAFLWDLAGQPGYRVYHQIHLDEVAVALVVFDSRSETDPFAGVSYWAGALGTATRGFPTVKFLVAARVDRGGPPVSQKRINELVKRYGFTSYLETSARRGDNIEELAQLIRSAIAWEKLPRVSAPKLFHDIKQFLVKEKAAGRVLARRDELLERYCTAKAKTDVPEDSFDTCLGRLETTGLLKRLTFGELVLLQPEMLDGYCAWLALAARTEPEGLGFIVKQTALRGEFPMDTERRLRRANEERLMLVATVEEVVGRGIALVQPTQQGDMLVFPSEVRTDMPDFPGEYVRAVTFQFDGPVGAIYATLAVSLIHSPAFTKEKLYRNAAVFHAPRSQASGFAVDYPEPGNDALGQLTVFFGADTEQDIKLLFLRFVNQHLEKFALKGSVKREQVYQCACGFEIPKNAVELRRKRGETTAICPSCGRQPRIDDLADESARPDEQVDNLALQARQEQERQKRLAVLAERESGSEFHVFLCHNSRDKRDVLRLAAKLRAQAILPWVDQREILAGGQFIPELEKVIEKVPAAAVIVGPHWMGAWQQQEYYAILQRFVERREGKGKKRLELIPILLPGAPIEPELPVFLRGFSYLDFRKNGIDDREQMRRLIKAILAESRDV
jgi:WD40 repeat protein